LPASPPHAAKPNSARPIVSVIVNSFIIFLILQFQRLKICVAIRYSCTTKNCIGARRVPEGKFFCLPFAFYAGR
jgi:hypothetical protein